MLGALVNRFLSSDTDRVFRRTSLENADFIFGGTKNTKTRKRIAKEAENRDLKLTDLDFADIKEAQNLHRIGEKINGKNLLYRHRSFSDLDSNNEKIDLLDSLYTLEQNYNVNLINDPLTAITHESKFMGNKLISNYTSNLENTRTVDIYSEDNINEAINHISEQGSLVAKPDNGVGGDSVQKLDSINDVRQYLSKSEDKVVFEEYVPHDQNSNMEDGRAYIVDGAVVAKAGRKNDEGLATNLAKGGDYFEASPLENYEEDAVVEAAKGLGFAAVDYVKNLEEDEVIIYEVNATPGTNYEDEMDGGLIDPVIDMMNDEEAEVSTEIDASANLNPELQYSAV